MSHHQWDEWVAFGCVVLAFLAVDLFLHRGDHHENRKRAIIWSIITILVGLAYGLHVWYALGRRSGEEYLAAYILEKSLSLDNLFVFLIIFRIMKIPTDHQRVALSWGIFGALVFRAIFIFLGLEIIHRWAWVEYIFAVMLLYAAWHALREQHDDCANEHWLVTWLMKHLPVSQKQEHPRFFVKEMGAWKVTPLLVAVFALEASDVMFAIDSVPAAFAVTSDPYLIYTSNVFAILGLRSLYIVLAHTVARLRYLHYGLAGVLALAGTKMLLRKGGVEIEPLVASALTVGVISLAVIASLLVPRRHLSAPAESSSPSTEGSEQQRSERVTEGAG